MISFCIPAYLYVDYTAEAVQSLIDQPDDFEVIVTEDFDRLAADVPERRSVERVRDLLHSDPRIKAVRNSEPLTIQQNWNQAVGRATRPYVKVMGADDRVRPGAVRRLTEIVAGDPSVVIHGHLADVIDAAGRPVRQQVPYNRIRQAITLEPQRALKLKLAQVARFKEPVCNVFQKAAWERVGGYPQAFRFCFDVAFNVSMMALGRSCLWSESLVELRRHDRSDGATLPPELALAEVKRLIDDIYLRLGSALTAADRRHGDAWLAYRTLELAAARYRRQPARLAGFLLRHWRGHGLRPGSIGTVGRMVWRRLRQRDIQLMLEPQP